MGYVTLKFLGEEYQISETIIEFLHYDKILTPIRVKILQRLSQDINRDARELTFGEHTTNYVDNNAKVYQKLMQESANILINKLFELGIYDVTSNELLSNVTSISDLDELKLRTLNNMLAEGRKFIDMKNAGMERAYRSAASNITGSGVMIFTNSITSLMIHSVVERGILLSQAKQADREYEEAVRAINASTRRALDTMVSAIMIRQYYPEVMSILMEFNTKIMSAFLVELVQHEKFDFASIEKYNMEKAEQMLGNINRVSDKAVFLKQVFNICPFSLDVYETCLEEGLLDIETFNTATYFGFADSLIEKIEEYINRNLDTKNKIEPVVTILATYHKVDKKTIWRKIYKNTIANIELTYNRFNHALTDKVVLDEFVREYISPNMTEVVKKSQDDLGVIIAKTLSSVVPENDFIEYVEMGLISPEKIRKFDSTANDLNKINAEFFRSLMLAVMYYTNEAYNRFRRYKESKIQLDIKLKEMQKELKRIESEKEKLGIFSFSKKKELTLLIETKKKQLIDYENTHESKKLWKDFERMYKKI